MSEGGNWLLFLCISRFIQKLLKSVSLLLLLFAISQPWLLEDFTLWWRGTPHVHGETQYWSFQRIPSIGHNLLFSDFWFPRVDYEAGIFYGWFGVFVFQVLTIFFGTVSIFKEKIKGREWHSDLSAVFLFLTMIMGVYQLVIQNEVQSVAGYEWFSISLSDGFRTAILSAMIFLVACYLERKGRLKNLFTSLRKQWRKTIPIALVTFVVFFFLLSETQAQTGVTKLLCVEKKMEQYPSDPKFWENDFNRIVMVASIFRGKIVTNSPSYAYCYIATPVASYQILLSIYISMGYRAYQAIPLHLL